MDTEVDKKNEIIKPSILYHASANTNIEEFEPRNRKVRDVKEGPIIFATPDKTYASMFLAPTDDSWSAKGRHDGVFYQVISDRKRFQQIDKGGAIYNLPPETFETDLNKGAGELDWTSKVAVKQIDKKVFKSALETMMDLGVQVFFVDKLTFEAIQSSNDHGYTILQTLQSENQRLGKNIQRFGDNITNE